MRRKITYCLLFLGFASCVFGQQKLSLNLVIPEDFKIPKKLKPAKNIDNQDELNFELNNLISGLHKNGFVTASIDSTVCKDSVCNAYLFLGNQYEIIAAGNGNIDKDFWQKLGGKKKGKYSFEDLTKLEMNLLKAYENDGYPYAQVWLDSFQIVDNVVSAYLYSDVKDQILIDSVIVHGKTKTKSKFLQRYLGIKPGDNFNQQKLNAIPQKIKQLSYISESRPAELYFEPGTAELHIFLKREKSNQFNLIIGVLPNDELVDKKVTVTGDGRLQLLNSFGVGEEIFAEFRQIKPRTQNLDISFSYPYLLNSPIGIFGEFNLYKNDTLFIDINSEVGVLYQFGGFNQLKLFYHNQSSNILNIDSNSIKASGQLPTTLDLRNNQYGASLSLQKLDYVLNPRKGYLFKVSGLVGVKKIKENQSVAGLIGFDGNALRNQYDSIEQKRINYSIGFGYSQFFPIRKRSTFLLRNVSEFYISKNILNNEEFRIGGNKLLRGFDEEAIYTPFYSIFTAEFRFLLSKNSHISLFSDFAIVEDERSGAGNVDFPLGFGAGLALETKGGIFSLSYALGRNLDNPIQFKNGKIHFGFVSIF